VGGDRNRPSLIPWKRWSEAKSTAKGAEHHLDSNQYLVGTPTRFPSAVAVQFEYAG